VKSRPVSVPRPVARAAASNRAGRMPATSKRTKTMISLDKETEAWLAIRKEAGKAINPATAKVMSRYAAVDNEYGVFPDDSGCIGRVNFARAPGSDVWVSFYDLPESICDELWKRLERKDPDGPSPFDPDLPDVKRLVTEIMARDDGEPGYATAVARGIMKARAARATVSAPDGAGDQYFGIGL
jgi:hypothetical protein